jgi:hypothetical protein
MFLRSNNRKKDGKDHRYFSVVENHRIASGKTVQRTVVISARSTINNRGTNHPVGGHLWWRPFNSLH